MATDKQRKRAIEAGSALGLTGGAVLGYKGAKGAGRVKRGVSWGRSAYKMTRKDLKSGRPTAAAAAARVARSGIRGPKKGPTLTAIGAGYLGGVSGSYGGGLAGEHLSERWKYKKKTPVSKAEKQQQTKGYGAMGVGGALTTYGAAHAPILRSGYKDKSKMTSASPKQQGKRYQAELHQAMKAGRVDTDSPVHVLRTPSGRHINAGGTHRQIAREAMGKPSQYQIKDISHEVHVSPVQRIQGQLRVHSLKRGSKAAEAGKKVSPVSTTARATNKMKAAKADIADAHIWSHPSAIKPAVQMGRKVGLANAGLYAGAGALLAGAGAAEHHQWKKQHSVAKRSVSAFGIDHGVGVR